MLPQEFLETNIIENMAVGATGYTEQANFSVDNSYYCHLNPRGLVVSVVERELSNLHPDKNVAVTRLTAGYRVTLPLGVKIIPAVVFPWGDGLYTTYPLIEVC